MKLPAKLGIAAVVVAALWSGGWFVGKSVLVEPEADKAVEALRAGDLFFSYETRVVGGFPLAYDIVYEEIAFSDASGLWRYAAPSLKVGSGVADAGSLRLEPAAAGVLTVEPAALGGGPDDAPSVFDVSSDGMVARLSGGVEGGRIEIDAAALQIKQTAGASAIRDGVLRFDALTAIGARDATGDVASLDISADEAEIGYRLTFDGVAESRSSTTMRDFKTTFEGSALTAADLPTFIAERGEGALVVSASSYTGTGASTGGPTAPSFATSFKGGAMQADISIKDDRIVYEVGGDATTYVFEDAAALGLPPGEMTMAAFEMSFEMPVRKTDGVASYEMDMEMKDFAVGDSLWTHFDPAAAIDRAPLTVKVDLGGDVRLLADIGDPNHFGQPFDVETLKIEEISINGLGVEANAVGLLDVAGDASLPDGEIELEVRGLLGLIDQLAAAGVTPEGMDAFYRSILLAYAEVGDDPDHLTAVISARNGQTTINGKPLQ